MHKNLLKAKEVLETSLECVVKDTCPEKVTKTEICLIKEIVDGIHTINKIIVDDSMRIQFFEKFECLKEIRDIDELVDMYDEFMEHREKEGFDYRKQGEKNYRGGGR